MLFRSGGRRAVVRHEDDPPTGSLQAGHRVGGTFDCTVRAPDDAVEIAGPDDPEKKEQALLDFADGRIRVLITKPSIAGFGMNLQRCSRMAFVGVSDSWESYYQAVRRCYRFGQRNPVQVHIFASDAEGSVIDNLARKEADAKRMADELSAETQEALRANVLRRFNRHNPYSPQQPLSLPSWLKGSAHV